uniref:Uncharacterized protein n=2 Tax=Oryza TaxID=4527 RepID=A0A0D3GYL0_9ORYZ
MARRGGVIPASGPDATRVARSAPGPHLRGPHGVENEAVGRGQQQPMGAGCVGQSRPAADGQVDAGVTNSPQGHSLISGTHSDPGPASVIKQSTAWLSGGPGPTSACPTSEKGRRPRTATETEKSRPAFTIRWGHTEPWPTCQSLFGGMPRVGSTRSRTCSR